MKKSDLTVNTAPKDDQQGDVLGLNVFREKKRLLSNSSVPDVVEENKDTKKKRRLGWGEGLAKYEQQLKKDAMAIRPEHVPRSSHGSNLPPGENNASGNSMPSSTEVVVPSTSVLPTSGGCSPPTDVSSSTKLTKAQDLPKKVVSQHSNNIQKSTTLPRVSIILQNAQKSRKLSKMNVLSDEPQHYKHHESRFKEFSGERNCMEGMLGNNSFAQHPKNAETMETYLDNNDNKGKGKEGNHELSVVTKEYSGIESCHRVTSKKKKENVDGIPEGNDRYADMGNPRRNTSPCIVTNAAMLRGKEFVQHLKDSEAMDTDSEDNDDKVNSKEGNPEHYIASKEFSGIQMSCNVISWKGKEKIDINPSPEVNDLHAPPMLISNEEPKIYHLSSSLISPVLETVNANSSHIQMDIDLNVPIDITQLDETSVDQEKSHAESSIGVIEPCQTTNYSANDMTNVQRISHSRTTLPQNSHEPANQAGCIRLFGQVIHQAPSSVVNHTPGQGQGNQISVSSSDMPSSSMVHASPRDGQMYPSGHSNWTSVPSILGQEAVLSNSILPYGLTNGAAALHPLQPGISPIANIMSQMRQPVANTAPYNINIIRGGVPASFHLIPGSSNASFFNFNGFNPVVQQQWPTHILEASRMALGGYPVNLPNSAAPNQVPNTATMPSGRNGEGTSTNNARFPTAGRGRARNP